MTNLRDTDKTGPAKSSANPAVTTPAVAQDDETSHLAGLSERASDRVHGRQIDNKNHDTQGRQTAPRELKNRQNIGRGGQ